MTEQDVITLHNIARGMESSGAGNLGHQLREIADRLSSEIKVKKQVEESWKLG
jgi:hypothetical protein